jgi:DNA polymerase III epsilon subunit-like protein
VKPKNIIPYYITKINGISKQMVRNAPGIDSALNEFFKFTREYPLLRYNIISFDMKFINAVNEELNGTGQSLSSLCKYYDIDTSGAHRCWQTVR